MKYIFLAITFFSSILYCQKKEREEVYFSKYRIVSGEFKEILDSFLRDESLNAHFSLGKTNMIFPITVMDSIGSTIQLTSGKEGLFITPDLTTRVLGIVKYKGVLFMINGRSLPSEKILINTRTKKGILVETSVRKEEPIEDDSFFPTVWIIKIEADSLKIIYRSKMSSYK